MKILIFIVAESFAVGCVYALPRISQKAKNSLKIMDTEIEVSKQNTKVLFFTVKYTP
ncbi:MAG: hypothetical protein H7325_01620 [Pedobacter sp.]|nr:hypothetical protein [Pedobacter sp.]